MTKLFHLEVVTPERILLSENIESLVVPAHDGALGVLVGHAPLLCVLKPGEIKIRKEGLDRWYLTTGGFMEVLPRKTSLLVETAEDIREIDVARAERARDRARERLETSKKEIDTDRVRLSLARALARLMAVSKHGR